MHPWLHSLLDLFFPPKCIYCQAVLSSGEEGACPTCITQLPWIEAESILLPGKQLSHQLSVAWYEHGARDAILRYKFKGQRHYAPALSIPLANKLTAQCPGWFDLISWIPVSRETLQSRGYDQARLLAEEVSARLDLPAKALLFARKKPPQSSLSSASARRENIKEAFSLMDPSMVLEKRILLIDYVVTTGSTLEEAASILLKGGAKTVFGATFCRSRPNHGALSSLH